MASARFFIMTISLNRIGACFVIALALCSALTFFVPTAAAQSASPECDTPGINEDDEDSNTPRFVPLECVEGTRLAGLYKAASLGDADGNFSGSLSDYINRIFFFAITIGGVLAVLRIAWAGFLYITTDLWSSKEKAKEVLQETVLGLLLLLSVWLILFQINPQILSLDLDFTVPQTLPPEPEPEPELPTIYSSVSAIPPDSSCYAFGSDLVVLYSCHSTAEACEAMPNRPTICAPPSEIGPYGGYWVGTFGGVYSTPETCERGGLLNRVNSWWVDLHCEYVKYQADIGLPYNNPDQIDDGMWYYQATNESGTTYRAADTDIACADALAAFYAGRANSAVCIQSAIPDSTLGDGLTNYSWEEGGNMCTQSIPQAGGVEICTETRVKTCRDARGDGWFFVLDGVNYCGARPSPNHICCGLDPRLQPPQLPEPGTDYADYYEDRVPDGWCGLVPETRGEEERFFCSNEDFLCIEMLDSYYPGEGAERCSRGTAEDVNTSNPPANPATIAPTYVIATDLDQSPLFTPGVFAADEIPQNQGAWCFQFTAPDERNRYCAPTQQTCNDGRVSRFTQNPTQCLPQLQLSALRPDGTTDLPFSQSPIVLMPPVTNMPATDPSQPGSDRPAMTPQELMDYAEVQPESSWMRRVLDWALQLWESFKSSLFFLGGSSDVAEDLPLGGNPNPSSTETSASPDSTTPQLATVSYFQLPGGQWCHYVEGTNPPSYQCSQIRAACEAEGNDCFLAHSASAVRSADTAIEAGGKDCAAVVLSPGEITYYCGFTSPLSCNEYIRNIGPSLGGEISCDTYCPSPQPTSGTSIGEMYQCAVPVGSWCYEIVKPTSATTLGKKYYCSVNENTCNAARSENTPAPINNSLCERFGEYGLTSTP